ncbi:MAG: hypothetical protein MZV49_14210 [Rhodopseudomonas palustris]|nr:hypothetical protein [Rhodopseudomonas palustris]
MDRVPMQTAHPIESIHRLSPTIYAGMVDLLFLNPLPMVLGAMSPAIAAAVIGAVTDDVVIWLCVLPFLALGGVRAFQMYHKQRQGPLTGDEAVLWENKYRLAAIG